MTTDPAAVAALARAIHTSNDHGDRPGCIEMDEDSAAAILATDWTPAERAALAAAIGGEPVGHDEIMGILTTAERLAIEGALPIDVLNITQPFRHYLTHQPAPDSQNRV